LPFEPVLGGSYSMGKFELKVLKFSISCSPKRGRINILPINYVWFSLVNVFERCGLNMQYINAPNIILGIMDPAITFYKYILFV
jgi:hypothetical protein